MIYIDITKSLTEAAGTTKRRDDRSLMREAADLISKMRQDAIERGDTHRAWINQAECAAARRGVDAGFADGYQRGVEVALNRLEPGHAATMKAWQQKRIEEVAAGYRSVRSASVEMGWMDEDVQIAAFGEVRQ